jgi:hypothetical protein
MHEGVELVSVRAFVSSSLPALSLRASWLLVSASSLRASWLLVSASSLRAFEALLEVSRLPVDAIHSKCVLLHFSNRDFALDIGGPLALQLNLGNWRTTDSPSSAGCFVSNPVHLILMPF